MEQSYSLAKQDFNDTPSHLGLHAIAPTICQKGQPPGTASLAKRWLEDLQSRMQMALL
ncbi:MAG TPA: hypothetical protein V6D19_00595 [Stenomitos sp.]